MTREIRFRAWWPPRNKMLNCVEHFYDTLGDDEHGNEYEPESSFGSILDNPKEYIVMQYTGITDKNGKEIYEGDVIAFYLKYEEHGLASKNPCLLVEWDDTGWSPFSGGSTQISRAACFIEVIGNIYENPKLLEDNK